MGRLRDAFRPRRTARRPQGEAVPIGLLFSLTGGLAAIETSVCQGALLAIDEVNAAGGIQGRPVEAVIEDYASDCTLAPIRAGKLISEHDVIACVGGYISASRVATAPAIRAADSLLLYPTYFEGLEEDPHVFYFGAVPNQYLLDYIAWVLAHLGTRIYMVGSDYVYPRAVGTMIRKLVADAGGQVMADRYVPLGGTDFAEVVAEISADRPDVVVSNIVGSDSTAAFYRRFRAAGHTAASLPIAATVTTEVEVQAMGAENAAGHFMIATYFGSLDNPANNRYRAAMRARFGPDSVTHVTQVGAYNAVQLFARAADRAPDLTAPSLRAALVGTTFDGNPEGWPVRVHPNHHTDHPCYIGCTRDDGQFDVIAQFEPRAPDPYPEAIVPSFRRPPVGQPAAGS
ncbi:MAG: transporter substrate-binding protein [Solirubrobacterales bacterium]